MTVRTADGDDLGPLCPDCMTPEQRQLRPWFSAEGFGGAASAVAELGPAPDWPSWVMGYGTEDEMPWFRRVIRNIAVRDGLSEAQVQAIGEAGDRVLEARRQLCEPGEPAAYFEVAATRRESSFEVIVRDNSLQPPGAVDLGDLGVELCATVRVDGMRNGHQHLLRLPLDG